MAFGFFKDKSKEPIEVTCPLCGHIQQESPLAVSSYCKGCKAYLSFRKGGEIVARTQASSDPFSDQPSPPKDIEHGVPVEEAPASPVTPKTPESKPSDPAPKPPPKPKLSPKPKVPPEPKTTSQDKSASVDPSLSESKKPHQPFDKKHSEIESNSKPVESPKSLELDTEQEGLAPRYHRQNTEEEDQSSRSKKKKGENERLISCFECGDSHVANARANSTQCRQCGRLISMADQHIKEAWTSRIQTRGDVYIHKKGVVLGASIQCHNLTVEGDFTGSAECSGDLTLRRHGKIVGNVVCDRLLVQRRAKVEFQNLVEMNECQIDGLVTGDLSCRGRLALEKKATLTGNIKVGTLTIADGAKHSGQIQMGGF